MSETDDETLPDIDAEEARAIMLVARQVMERGYSAVYEWTAFALADYANGTRTFDQAKAEIEGHANYGQKR